MARERPLFFDTPALIAQAQGIALYPEQAKAAFKTGVLNLLEVVHYFLRRHAEERAHRAYEEFKRQAEGFTRERIFNASRFRVRHQDRGISYADAMGYVTAQELGAIFLTTDRGFSGLKGVRLVPRR